jgi:hypothetical protein
MMFLDDVKFEAFTVAECSEVFSGDQRVSENGAWMQRAACLTRH